MHTTRYVLCYCDLFLFFTWNWLKIVPVLISYCNFNKNKVGWQIFIFGNLAGTVKGHLFLFPSPLHVEKCFIFTSTRKCDSFPHRFKKVFHFHAHVDYCIRGYKINTLWYLMIHILVLHVPDCVSKTAEPSGYVPIVACYIISSITPLIRKYKFQKILPCCKLAIH